MVAALTVLALVAAVVVQYTAGTIHSRRIVGTEFAAATFLFMFAIFEALGIVGTVMRHGLWRARCCSAPIRQATGEAPASWDGIAVSSSWPRIECSAGPRWNDRALLEAAVVAR